MPIPNTPVPQYPNVPQSPGVPPLLRSVNRVNNVAVQLVSDAANIASLFLGPQWGLFLGGQPAFSGVSSGLLGNVLSYVGFGGIFVGELAILAQSQISTAPQEQGAFVSYDKVTVPFSGRVGYIVTGPDATLNNFLQQADSYRTGTTILDLVMPEGTFPSVNVIHYDLRRSAQSGVTMVKVDVWVEQIRISATAAYSNQATATPDGANPQNGGGVQAQTPTAAQQQGIPGGGY